MSLPHESVIEPDVCSFSAFAIAASTGGFASAPCPAADPELARRPVDVAPAQCQQLPLPQSRHRRRHIHRHVGPPQILVSSDVSRCPVQVDGGRGGASERVADLLPLQARLVAERSRSGRPFEGCGSPEGTLATG